VYKVEKGDFLSTVAYSISHNSLYGKNNSIEFLTGINQIKNKNLIYPNQKIKIPVSIATKRHNYDLVGGNKDLLVIKQKVYTKNQLEASHKTSGQIEPVLATPAFIDERFLPKKYNFGVSAAVTLNQERFFETNNLGEELRITSPWSAGFMMGAEYNFTEKFSVWTTYYLAGMLFKKPRGGATLFQADRYASCWDMGVKYVLSRYFNLQGYFGFKQDFNVYMSTPLVQVDEFWHGFFGTALGYHLWQVSRVSVDGVTGFELYLPVEQTGYRTSSGNAINTEIKVSLQYNPGPFAFFRYEFFQIRPNNFVGHYGHYFMFGFGATFSR
jgi:hypothetical protein